MQVKKVELRIISWFDFLPQTRDGSMYHLHCTTRRKGLPSGSKEGVDDKMGRPEKKTEKENAIKEREKKEKERKQHGQ